MRTIFAFVLVVTWSCLSLLSQELQVGYSIVTAGPGGTVPVATALFSFTNPNGALLWEAGVAAAEPIRSGRIFAERSATTRTAIALVNASGALATTTLTLRDAAGALVAARTRSFAAGEHRAQFLEEIFDPLPASFSSGSLTFESDQKLAAITLRENKNTQGEALYATLPVVDLAAAASTASLVFPHIAIGGGFSTQVVLVNASNQRVAGKIRLTRSDSTPLLLGFGSELPYDIPPGGTFRAELTSAGDVQVGYATVVLEQGAAMPSGSAIFQIKKGNDVVSEAGVAAIAATQRARIFVDNAGTSTAVAMASAGNLATVVTATLIDRNGNAIATTTLDLPAAGHRARFVHELFPGLPVGFTGLMEISSTVPLVSITLKLTTNTRAETILTTLPVADLSRPPSSASVVFPQIAIGAGYSTRLLFINAETTRALAGALSFFQSSGVALAVPLVGQTNSQFAYQLGGGAARQFRPGDAAAPRQIILDLLSSGNSEIAVNEGNSLQLNPAVIDSQGKVRDDFPFSYTSLSTDVAEVDSAGVVRARKIGFSSLTINSATVVATATIMVARITPGAAGFEITGLAQDSARRIFLADNRNHTILRALSIAETPQRYAGVSQTSGLRDDARLNALFNGPSFLSFNQEDGGLYVSDSGNNRIRRVGAGPGQVETVNLGSATLSNPQGVILDNRGNLWVADSGTHTIKRINLSNNTVETVAGQAGSPGLADGVGVAARFRSPGGIALETESLAQQLERERTGTAPPPTSVIVADTGNGRIRRVKQDGTVETIGVDSALSAGLTAAHLSPAGGRSRLTTPLVFNSPLGVAVDSFANIYVTEPDTRQVKTILRNGRVVPAAQPNTFAGPTGIVVNESGRVMVAEKNRTAQEITYAPPQIASLTPPEVSNRGGASVTIRGLDFAPDTLLFIDGRLIDGVVVKDTQTIVFTTPPLPSGRITATVQHRGGLAQRPLLVSAVALSQVPAGQITTIAGGTTYIGDGSLAAEALVGFPEEICLDAAGNLYIADTGNNRVRRVDAKTGMITTVAGTGVYGYNGDGVPAVTALLAEPRGIAVDAAGNIYVSDEGNYRIRKIDTRTGVISTFAGSASPGPGGDNGPATSAQLYGPRGLAFDNRGNLYIADRINRRVRKVDGATRVITTVAGNGAPDFVGDNGPATQAALAEPTDVDVDSRGNLYIADLHRIRRVDASSQIISTVVGKVDYGNSGDGGPPGAAFLTNAASVSLDASGNLWIADTGNQRIRRVDVAANVIDTWAGTGQEGFAGDNGAARDALLRTPVGVIADAAGNTFFVDRDNSRVRRIDAVTNVITTRVGTGPPGSFGDGGPATVAALNFPYGIGVSGNKLYIVEEASNRVRKVDLTTGVITAFAGTGEAGPIGDGGPALAAGFTQPTGLAVDRDGNVYIADNANHRIRKVDANTNGIATVAGNGEQGNSGDNGPATAARLAYPNGIAVDSAGSIYIADQQNRKIRRVDASGTITTYAGTGQSSYAGDNGQAVAASFITPNDVAVDSASNLYVADLDAYVIRRIDAATKVITTVAGTGRNEYSGDGGPAAQASLVYPNAIALDSADNLFIADYYTVRRVDAATKTISTVAGTGGYGFSGDNVAAFEATVDAIRLAFDTAGNLFITDRLNHRIRAVRAPVKAPVTQP